MEFKLIKRVLILFFVLCVATLAQAQQSAKDYTLGPGDGVRITIFQSPDLTTEARVSESGGITFPLIGTVPIGGLTLPDAERKIAQMLKDGGFVLKPQVNVQLTQIRGSQVAVLGQVNRPGRYPLETFNTHMSDMLAVAGGIAVGGADTVIVSGVRNGKAFKREIDIPAMFFKGDFADDIVLSGGDMLYVHRAPVFYIYGEVQRPGAFRLERDMTVMQALASGGGITLRGTVRGLNVHRRDASGKVQIIEPKMDDLLQPDDVVYIKESLF